MLTPSDLTRIEAIRDWAENGTMDPRRREELRWLLARLAPATPDDIARATEKMFAKMDAEDKATFNWWVASARRLAPATPSGAATAGEAREEDTAMRSPAITPEERERWRRATLLPKAVRATIIRLLAALDAADALAAAAHTVDRYGGGYGTQAWTELRAALAAYRAKASAKRSGAAPEICDGPAATCCCGRAHREGPATAAGAGEWRCESCGVDVDDRHLVIGHTRNEYVEGQPVPVSCGPVSRPTSAAGGK